MHNFIAYSYPSSASNKLTYRAGFHSVFFKQLIGQNSQLFSVTYYPNHLQLPTSMFHSNEPALTALSVRFTQQIDAWGEYASFMD